MSLVIRVSINEGPPLFVVTARRVEGGEQPDDLNTYVVERHEMPWSAAAGGTTSVRHRYGDGAGVLASKALEAVTSRWEAGAAGRATE